jgi:ubiquinone/menaquinone biosynthesis C-methylase UbiE
MANGMGSYEAAIAPTKQRLFGQVLANLPAEEAVVVELGMGTFPNARYYARVPGAPKRMDIVGVDPNVAMEWYAKNAAATAGLDRLGHSVRVVEGVGEALPLADGSADAVVCTLTLCSARSPAAVLAEVRRVLKPGGAFLFVEHVLSPTSELLAQTQRALTPAQVVAADNCHLDRKTLETIRSAGFAKVDAEEFELSGFWILSPTAAGIAVR